MRINIRRNVLVQLTLSKESEDPVGVVNASKRVSSYCIHSPTRLVRASCRVGSVPRQPGNGRKEGLSYMFIDFKALTALKIMI